MGPCRIIPPGALCSHHWNFPTSVSAPPSLVPAGQVIDWAAAGSAVPRSAIVPSAAASRITLGPSAREPPQRSPGETGDDPLLVQASAEPLVEADGRTVPVEHRPLQPSAAAPDRDAGQRLQERFAGARPALLRHHEQVFKVEGRLGQERGVREEVEREADRAAATAAEYRLERPPPPETLVAT